MNKTILRKTVIGQMHGLIGVMVIILSEIQISQAMIFEMTNHIRVEGKIIAIKKNEVFIINSRNLFIVEIPVIAKISDGDSIVAVRSLRPSGGAHINYNAFDHVIEINRENVSSYKHYPEIVKYTGGLNTAEPPFPRPPDPTIKKKWYVTIKPVRLIWHCADVTVSRRMIFQHGEVRLSYFYSPDLLLIGASGEADIILFGSTLQNMNVVSASCRYYFSTDGRGPFVGIGGSYGNFIYTNDFWAKLFSWSPLSINMPSKFEGGLIEFGITGTPFDFLISSPSLCLGIGQISYKVGEKWYNDKKVNWIPTFNWTLGILF